MLPRLLLPGHVVVAGRPVRRSPAIDGGDNRSVDVTMLPSRHGRQYLRLLGVPRRYDRQVISLLWRRCPLVLPSSCCAWNIRQWSQNVGAGGPHHAPMWEHTQSSAPCRCVPTSSLRFHAFGCWDKIKNYVSVDFVSKWREADDKFKIKYII